MKVNKRVISVKHAYLVSWRVSASLFVHAYKAMLPAEAWPIQPFYADALSSVNPFTPKSDQSPISPVASPEILHHTVWRTWLFIAYSNERLLHYQFSLPHPYISLEEGWENVLFELGSERVNPFTPKFKKCILPTF